MKHAIGHRLMDALTADEIACILDTVFSLQNKKETDRLLSELDPDIEAVVLKLLDPESSRAKTTLSDSKFLQVWKQLWNEWESVVSEVGDENGEYSEQENHWETPYFESIRFSEDLDKTARKMMPMLQRIVEMEAEPDSLFEDALEEIEGGIVLFPEWMGAEYSECILDSNTTKCVLVWTWLVSGKQAEPFLKHIDRIEGNLKYIFFSSNAFIQFFMNIAESRQKEIYDYLKNQSDVPQWENRLNRVSSVWHQIYQKYSLAHKPEIYLRNCKKFLEKNWEYGLPLIRHHLEEKEFVEAEEIYEKTIGSFVGDRDGFNWNPEKKLLIRVAYGFGSPDSTIIELLDGWIDLTGESKNLEPGRNKVNILKFQRVTYHNPYDWDAVAVMIDKVGADHIPELIEQWQDFIIKDTLEYDSRRVKSGFDCWIKWLIDAKLGENKGKSWFLDKMEQWLDSLASDKRIMNDNRELFFLLTHDLYDMTDLKDRYPGLLDVIEEDSYVERLHDKSRRKWFEETGGIQLTSMVESCWKKQAANMVPDPKDSSKAIYDRHALWLAAVKDLDPKKFEEIVEKWKEDHKRRRNLWKAIEDVGLKI